MILVGLGSLFANTALAQTVDLGLSGGSLRFPENNHETAFAGTYGALYQSRTNFPNLFSTDGSLFMIARIPIDRMHDNRRYKIVGASALTSGLRFSLSYYGTDYFTSANRGLVRGYVKSNSGDSINVDTPAIDEEDVLIVFKRKTNAGPSVDFTIDWYSLADATKHAGTAQTNVTFTGMGTYIGDYFGIGVGHESTLPSSGSKLTTRVSGEFPGEIQALGYVASDITDEDWQAIALGADIITTLGTTTLTYLREFDGTSDTYGPPAGATSDTTSAAVAVDGDNLSPGSTLRRQDSTNYLTFNYIPAGKVFALTPASTTRSVPFSGTAGGYTGDVEVRLIYADTGVVHQDWTTIGSISSGAWSGTTTISKSSDGWLIAQARPASNPEVVAEMREPFGVGYKFGVIGQSQTSIVFIDDTDGDQVVTPFKISVSSEVQYEMVAKKEKLFRVGPHPSSDSVAYFANQWAEYGDDTPVMLISFAEVGTSALQWVDDTNSTRDWSDTQAIVDYLGGDFTGLLWQWGTSDNLGTAYGTGVFDAVVKGVGDNASDHYLEDGLTFEPGFGLGLGQFSRHSSSSAGPFDSDQSQTYGATRDTQITWIQDNSYTLGPSFSDVELEGAGGPHQEDTTVLRGSPLFGTRLAMTAARIVGLDTATDPSVDEVVFTDINKNSILVTFTLPNAGSLQTNDQDSDVRGFEVSDDSGSTWSRSSFTAARSGNTVTLTKTSGAWTGGGATRVRYLFGGPVSYGTSVDQTELLDGLLYESYDPDVLGLGLPVMGSNTALTVTTDETAPAISDIATSASQNTATITWTTDEAATSTLHYGATDSYGSTDSSDTATTSHSVSLTSLTANTTYHYQINVWDASGNLATSSDATFTTTAAASVVATTSVNTTSGGSGYDLAYIAAHQSQPNTVEGIRALIAQLTKQLNQLQSTSANGISSSAFTSSLRSGQNSSQIKILQQILNQDPDTQITQTGAGSPGHETNFFGALTLNAVKRFQLKHQIVSSPADPGYGLVGPKTRGKLNELLEAGN